MKHIWVIEWKYQKRGEWEPYVWEGESRAEARDVVRLWNKTSTHKYRVRKYVPEEEK